MSDLVFSIVTGAAGGLVVLVVGRLWESIRQRRQMKAQIAYIARVVAEYRAKIYDVSGESAWESDDQRYWLYFEFFEYLARLRLRPTRFASKRLGHSRN